MKRQISLTLFFLILFSVATVFSQSRTEDRINLNSINPKHSQLPKDQCKEYNKADFVGGTISFNIVNTDLRDVLNYITEQFGCKFVVDESVKQVMVTAKFNDVAWNIVLDTILKSKDLAVQVDGQSLFIAAKETLLIKMEKERNCFPNEVITEKSLYTEFIKLKKLRFPSNVIKNESFGSFDIAPLTGEQKTFQDLFKPLLSRRGAIEIDFRNNALVITDTKARLKLLVAFVELLDNSGIKFDELVNKAKVQNK